MTETNSKGIRLLVFILGMSSVIFQVIILREFLSVVQGNELTIGIILASWMMITGLGSLSGKISQKINNKANTIIYLQFLIAVLPIVSVFILRIFWYEVFLTGKLLSIIEVTLSSLIILLPFTFLSGFMFTLFCAESGSKKSIGKYYFWDTLGSVAGGVLVSLVLIFIFDTIQIVLFISFINLIVLIFFTYQNNKKYFTLTLLILVLGNLVLFTTDLNDFTKSRLFPNQKLIEQKDTPFGNVAVTKTGNQYNVLESGILSATSDNVIQNEETVHFAMLQHPNPKIVLLIGGGFFGVTNEILKYKPSQIDCVEPNVYLIEIDKKYGRQQTEDSRRQTAERKDGKTEGRKDRRNSESYFDKLSMTRVVEIIIQDPLIFLKVSKNNYDVIIVNIPTPATAQLNRYYTKEFFSLVKEHLNKLGVVSLKMPATANYVSKEASEEQSIIMNTLRSVFKNVIIIPSNSNYFIAGDGKLTYSFPDEIETRNIKTKYVNKFYLNEFSLMQRADFISEALDSNAEINTNFKPVAFYSHINYFLSYFETSKFWLIFSICIIFGLVLIRLNTLDFVMFTVGYALSLSEIIIIFSFQIIFGYVYQYIGLIIALFMLGMSVGTFVVSKYSMFKARNSILVFLIIIFVFLILLPLVLKGMNSINAHEIIIHFVFAVLLLTVSFLTGGLFSLLSMQSESNVTNVAGNIYSADLFGSALGAILVSVFLLPVIGFEWSCFSGAGLVLVGIAVYKVRYRN